MSQKAVSKAVLSNDKILEKSANILQAVSIDGWSNRTTPFLLDLETSETTAEKYEENNLTDQGELTSLGNEVKDALNGYIKDLREEDSFRMDRFAHEVPGVRKTAIGYSIGAEPEESVSSEYYLNEAGENIGAITNKRGDNRRYRIFSDIAARNPVRQAELNKELDMPRGSISRILGEYEEEGLIEKYSPTGESGNLIELTSYGERLESLVSDIEGIAAESNHF